MPSPLDALRDREELEEFYQRFVNPQTARRRGYGAFGFSGNYALTGNRAGGGTITNKTNVGGRNIDPDKERRYMAFAQKKKKDDEKRKRNEVLAELRRMGLDDDAKGLMREELVGQFRSIGKPTSFGVTNVQSTGRTSKDKEFQRALQDEKLEEIRGKNELREIVRSQKGNERQAAETLMASIDAEQNPLVRAEMIKQLRTMGKYDASGKLVSAAAGAVVGGRVAERDEKRTYTEGEFDRRTDIGSKEWDRRNGITEANRQRRWEQAVTEKNRLIAEARQSAADVAYLKDRASVARGNWKLQSELDGKKRNLELQISGLEAKIDYYRNLKKDDGTPVMSENDIRDLGAELAALTQVYDQVQDIAASTVSRGQLNDPAIWQQYLDRANGDQRLAEQMALEDGWE